MSIRPLATMSMLVPLREGVVHEPQRHEHSINELPAIDSTVVDTTTWIVEESSKKKKNHHHHQIVMAASTPWWQSDLTMSTKDIEPAKADRDHSIRNKATRHPRQVRTTRNCDMTYLAWLSDWNSFRGLLPMKRHASGRQNRHED